MSDQLCIHCYVSGKVQGVWYRASTKTEADKLGICGFARNLPDGRVEVHACGERTKVMQLLEWLKRGPRLANVTEVTVDVLPFESHQNFRVS
ncbi:MAG: acylphosphatase [Gammaproteobacteria bacterium RIFCSPHIGHO2_12_FULL_43_28]|nr:MAG: acylphosphatase [Gammaproteobacteria bacterium RIFCSPHIGHO2_12_FULL_43_28]